MLRVYARRVESVSARIASRLNPAREKAIDPSFRFKTKYSDTDYSTAIWIVGIPSAVAFMLLTLLPSQSSESVLGWRVLAHLGPYKVPKIFRSGTRWKSALVELDNSDLLESEISQLLTDIEVITQRRQCVRRIVSEYGFEIFLPVFRNLSSPPPVNCTSKGQSHFETNLRVAMDVVSATRAKDRRVPISVIEDLIVHNLQLWECTGNEEVMRFREYRALLLLKLLQNEDNANDAAKSSIVCEFLKTELQSGEHIKFSTLPLMPLLYQFKTEKLGYEYSDIIYKCLKLLGLSSNENSPERKSLSLEHKIDFLNFEKLIYFTICYSSLRVIPLISEYSLSVLSKAANLMAKSVIGVAILEGLYRIEEHVIQSRPYFEKADQGEGILPSALMVITHVLVGSQVLRKFPFCFAPFAVMKIRDSFTDSFRFL
jgi:hypothetical protein